LEETDFERNWKWEPIWNTDAKHKGQKESPTLQLLQVEFQQTLFTISSTTTNYGNINSLFHTSFLYIYLSALLLTLIAYRPGELILLDAGCEYHGYASDITRTFPVSGVYSSAQRELYDGLLEVQEECIKVRRREEREERREGRREPTYIFVFTP
jgi:hypothetical protein